MDNEKYINICLGYKSVDWFLKNKDIVLKEGQLVFSKETNLFIIGDGVKPLYKLKFFSKENIGLGNVNNTADSEKKHDYLSGLNTGDYKHLTSVEYDRFSVMPRTVLLNTEEDVYGMTGGSSNAIVYSKLIPANTFEIGDLIKVEIRVRRVSAGTNNLQLRLSFSTSPTTTPTYLCLLTAVTTQNTGTIERNIKVVSNTTVRTITVGKSIKTDTLLTASTINVETIPTITSDIYFNVRITNGGGVLDTSYIDFIHVQIIKKNQ